MSLIGRDTTLLDEVAAEVMREVEGRLVTDKEVETAKREGTPLKGSEETGKL